ncbi:MAG TPA: hypothetical protein VGH75_04120, partial [Steroidobacteraceae bacterium]
TFGPLIFPGVMFGEGLHGAPGTKVTLSFDLASVAGLKQVQLVGRGAVERTQSFPQGLRESHVEFEVPLESAGWYALTVEDQRGRKAYSDPIWTADIVPATAARGALHP